ncbi:uncharacterized protein K02A2.6-like [Copidosoma floridanum]|uniref:uncharacterized protein K02A2.6-like n=1 Tax=Copidosoma floridanum TaxID=29053 RepID=UPI000C6F7242|nr:uncharacterized protein K02A2.6-like [Copidosoma floridanum]
MERYKFKECRQQQGEDVKTYLANLKKLSKECNFGAGLEDYLRDQFVWGIASEAIQKRLLGEKDLSYQKAYDIAQSMEAAGRDAARMQTKTGADALNYIKDKRRATQGQKKGPSEQEKCFCCGRANHRRSECRYKDYRCKQCGKVGHLQAMCKNKDKDTPIPGNQGRQRVKKASDERQDFVEEEEDGEIGSLSEVWDSVFCMHEGYASVNKSSEPLYVSVSVEGKPLRFEMDTGSPISAISEKIYNEHVFLRELSMGSTKRIFKTYHEQRLIPIGILNVNVKRFDKAVDLELFVMPGGAKTPIMGREWLRALGIIGIQDPFDLNNIDINSVRESKESINTIIHRFSDVFSNEMGLYKGGKFTLHVKPDTIPIFCKVRSVPFALRSRLEDKIQRLEKAKIIEPIKSSDWATPVVPVLKSSGQIRLCGDYKISLNPNLIVDKYPIPRVADMLSSLEGGKFFSKLDLAHAYQQIELDEKSKNLTTVTTHKGLYRYNRLPYGIASAPGLFQREMEKVLNGMHGVSVYFDDVFISGKTQEQHDKRLLEVLSRFQKTNLKVKIGKCEFSQNKIQFLGYELTEQGLSVAKNKIDAILKMKTPSHIKELRSFIGALTYNARFIKNFAMLMSPLYRLLKKDVEWHWTPEHDRAFEEAKNR